MKTKYTIGIVSALIVGLITFKLSANKKELNEKKQDTKTTAVRIPVRIDSAEMQTLEVNILKTGNITPFKEAKVFSVTSGIIERLNINLGDRVKQGQVVAKIDTRTQQLDLQRSESNVAKLKNDLQTYTELLAGKAATQEQVNSIRQDYLNAVNESRQIRKQIADASIKAPTGGVISSKVVEQGIFVNGGAEIATIINLSQAKVEVNLTEAEVYQVKVGQQVKITADVYPGKVFSGTVRFISPQADQTRNYRVEIQVLNGDSSPLKSGTFVYADFSKRTQQQRLVIPREALTGSLQDAFVFLVENGAARQKQIQVSGESGSMVQVISGLKAGDIVVTSGQINLKEGTPVSITK
ncbi:efflux RND transporter periplasmic adaptor subunit [Desertivirga xinjiangensis]|uniref:efflux RND transporter periplasmic adaptor subunit n=1 Tax=Desertivirga xinjiangensis TaxID=539206 RepID=UPI00210B60DE|nr:efflux RND transporter periplasmic adaptor subunit [Pedobacter xinjiangensis]